MLNFSEEVWAKLLPVSTTESGVDDGDTLDLELTFLFWRPPEPCKHFYTSGSPEFLYIRGRVENIFKNMHKGLNEPTDLSNLIIWEIRYKLGLSWNCSDKSSSQACPHSGGRRVWVPVGMRVWERQSPGRASRLLHLHTFCIYTSPSINVGKLALDEYSLNKWMTKLRITG